MFAGSIFKMEVYYTPKFNTLQLITVHNSSRPLTQVLTDPRITANACNVFWLLALVH
jgi:hypothetical protein